MISFVVAGKPVGVNAAYVRRSLARGGPGMMLSPEARTWKQLVAGAAKLATRAPFDGPVAVTLTFFWPDRRHDVDSAVKLTLDAMQGPVYANDRQVERLVVDKRLDPLHPRVEVSVVPFPAVELVVDEAETRRRKDLLAVVSPKRRADVLTKRATSSVRSFR